MPFQRFKSACLSSVIKLAFQSELLFQSMESAVIGFTIFIIIVQLLHFMVYRVIWDLNPTIVSLWVEILGYFLTDFGGVKNTDVIRIFLYHSTNFSKILARWDWMGFLLRKREFLNRSSKELSGKGAARDGGELGSCPPLLLPEGAELLLGKFQVPRLLVGCYRVCLFIHSVQIISCAWTLKNVCVHVTA